MNILLMGAGHTGMTARQVADSGGTLFAQAHLLGLNVHKVFTLSHGAGREQFLILFKTDHEKALCYKLAHAHKQPAVYVVENITMRGEDLFGTGGLEFSNPTGYPPYAGQHDDITVQCHPTMPDGDFTLLPQELGSVYIQCQ